MILYHTYSGMSIISYEKRFNYIGLFEHYSSEVDTVIYQHILNVLKQHFQFAVISRIFLERADLRVLYGVNILEQKR